MSFNPTSESKNVIDLQLKQFIDVVSANQRFQHLVHNLTDLCWETCVDRPSSSLDSKTGRCLVNCIERFIDTTNFITNRFERVANEAGITED